jgi:hypothetical protein
MHDARASTSRARGRDGLPQNPTSDQARRRIGLPPAGVDVLTKHGPVRSSTVSHHPAKDGVRSNGRLLIDGERLAIWASFKQNRRTRYLYHVTT